MRALTLAFILGLAGCASSGGSGGGTPARDIMSWEGASAAELQKELGPPDATYTSDTGAKVLEYSWSRTQTTGGYAVSYGGYSQLGTQYVPTQVVSLNCKARFTIGPDDRVADVGWQGNGCLSQGR
jgi:hypothetical protein